MNATSKIVDKLHKLQTSLSGLGLLFHDNPVVIGATLKISREIDDVHNLVEALQSKKKRAA